MTTSTSENRVVRERSIAEKELYAVGRLRVSLERVRSWRYGGARNDEEYGMALYVYEYVEKPGWLQARRATQGW